MTNVQVLVHFLSTCVDQILVSSEPFFNESELKASLLSTTDNASEHTAVGSLIGSVRDLVSGKANNPEDARSRAQTNDMLAEVAADTIAMMPGVGWWKAGAIRASLLIDPKAGAKDNATEFGLNFAEGVALHGVSKYAGKALHDPAAARSLMSESVGLFKFGAGMGTVKAVFAEQTWHDKEGKFQFGDGLANVAKAGTIGGAIGVPAGMVGNRIARFGITQFAESGMNPRALSIGLGALSGYPAGAVFGGVDSAMRGSSVSDVLKTAHEGGMVGMFAGGLTGGFIRREAVPRTAGGDRRVTRVMELESPMRQSLDVSDGVPKQARLPLGDFYTQVEMPARTNLMENLQRLGNYRQGRLQVTEAVATSSDIAKAATTFEQFSSKAYTNKYEPSRLYEVNGVEIWIPETYAKQLDSVYNLRVMQERGMRPGATQTEMQQGNLAKQHLDAHPLKDRAHPADMVYLDEVADRNLIRRIEMLNSDWWQDAWHKKTYSDTFRAAATAGDDGVITFYKAKADNQLGRYTHHEWGHLLANNAKRDFAAYESATALEASSHTDRSKQGFSISEYAKRDTSENWAEHSAAITRAEPHDFFRTAEEAPLRTAMIGKSLAKSLALAPGDKKSPFAQQIGRRVQFIQEDVLPRAHELLEGYLLHGKPEEQVHAAKLLRELGDKRHFEMLKEVARTSKHPEVSLAAFDAGRQLAWYGKETWTGYDRTVGSNSKNQYIDYLVDQAQPGSRSREEALTYLEPEANKRAQGYYNLLTFEQNDYGQMRKLLYAMEHIPEAEPRQRAYDAAMRLAGNDANKKFGVALTVMQRVPSMQEQALRSMMHIDVVKTEPLLRDIARKPTHRLNGVAHEGLAQLDAQLKYERLYAQTRSHDEQVRIDAITKLGESGEMRAIEPLLRRFASTTATPKERALAYTTLNEKFTRQIVKAEVHRLTREDSRWAPLLRALIDHTVPPPGTFVNVKA